MNYLSNLIALSVFYFFAEFAAWFTDIFAITDDIATQVFFTFLVIGLIVLIFTAIQQATKKLIEMVLE